MATKTLEKLSKSELYERPRQQTFPAAPRWTRTS